MSDVTERLERIEGRLATQTEQLAKHGDQLASHDEKLGVIIKALEPLRGIEAFIRALGDDHESRIQTLEKRAGLRS